MVGNIIVAVLCNLVAAMILVSGIFSGIKNGWKVSLVKLFLTAGSLVGVYFLTPTFSDNLLGIAVEGRTLGSIIIPNYLSLGSVNSVIFTALFLAFYAFILFVCKIVKICMINALKNKKENKAKMLRAKSINPRAERMARRAAKKQLKAQYQQMKNRFWSRFFGCFINIIVAAAVGVVTLMPFGYIAKIMNKNGDKAYLVDGFEYTLNGVIPESVFDWAIHNEKAPTTDEVPEDGNEDVTPPATETPEPEQPAPEAPEVPEVENGAEE